jgi:Calcineurin-like phosphoesterase
MLSPRALASRRNIRIAAFLAALIVVVCAPPYVTAESTGDVVAIGDVHGDFDDFAALLRRIGLIDAQHHWTGGKTTLVQVGDLLDRGPKPRDVMDIVMSLQKEAPAAGGQVLNVLGNHEVMNIMGDLRYVTAENYASFADAHSEERRKSALQEYMKWRSTHAALLAELPQPVFELTESEWMTRHPAGFVEQREAFGPNGTYGKWLRTRPAVIEIGGTMFLHGGLPPNVAPRTIDGINNAIRDELKAFDEAKAYLVQQKLILPFFNLPEISAVVQAEFIAERKSRVAPNEQFQLRLEKFLHLGDWLSMRADGPLWFRGYDQWSEEQGIPQVDKVLHDYGVAHIVVGHTVQKGGQVRNRFAGKVFLIDTGMLSSYYPGGKASALDIRDKSKFVVEYMDAQAVLLDNTTEHSERMSGGNTHQ